MMDIEHTISYQMSFKVLFQGFDENNFKENKNIIATGFSPWISLTYPIRFGAIFANRTIYKIRDVAHMVPDVFRKCKNGDKTIDC